MRRGFLVISILMMSSCFLAAGGRGQSMDAPRFTYGIEWSYIGTFFNHFHHNYITSDGYRENELDSYFSYRNNAQILLNATSAKDSIFPYMQATVDFMAPKSSLYRCAGHII